MTLEQRYKKIATAVAAAVAHPMVPTEIAEGLAAIEEELGELRELVRYEHDAGGRHG